MNHIFKWMSFLACLAFVTGCASSEQVKPQVPTQETPSSDDQTMMIPLDAQKSPGGYAYVFLKQGQGIKPNQTDAVKVHLRVLNVEGTVVDEDTATLSMTHSTPFIEEMLGLMDIGSTVRVWGESETRIWEIELLGIDEAYQAPEDVQTPPDDAQILPELDQIRWRLVEPGHGDNVKIGQVLRIQASRWKSTGEILESNRASQGMLVFLNQQNAQLDPIHHAILQHMNEGAHVRLWIPGNMLESGGDIVEDLWLDEVIAALDTPESLVPTQNATNIAQGVDLLLLNESQENKLVQGDVVEIELNCWNDASGELVDSSTLRGHHEEMEIKPELGIWFDIMQQVAPEQSFMTWIKADALPENVGMGLVCRGTVFKKLPTQDILTPSEQENKALSDQEIPAQGTQL